MSEMAIKVTELVGWASGDCECFCFDTRSPSEITPRGTRYLKELSEL